MAFRFCYKTRNLLLNAYAGKFAVLVVWRKNRAFRKLSTVLQYASNLSAYGDLCKFDNIL